MRWHELHIGIAQARREKEARDERDIEQAEIAAAVGVTSAAYSRWERGDRKPSEEDVVKLAAYFGVTPAYLRYGVTSSAETTRKPDAPKLGPSVIREPSSAVFDESRRAPTSRRPAAKTPKKKRPGTA